MERQRLLQLYRWLVGLSLPRAKRVVFSDLWIVLVFLWSVLSDRPMSWACKRENWPPEVGCGELPSPSTLSRRVRTLSAQMLLLLLIQTLNVPPEPLAEHWLDGKPLPVGPATRDPDARVGRGAGMLAKGYKLHALWAACGSLEAWKVEPLNVAETQMAALMIPVLKGPGYLVGDHLFDWKVLYQEAGAKGVQLVVTPEKNASPIPGVRRQDPHRVIGLTLAQTKKGRELLHRRFGIDRLFGQLGNQGGGLGPLPNWVRRLPRVRRWVAGKLLWFSFRRRLKLQDL